MHLELMMLLHFWFIPSLQFLFPDFHISLIEMEYAS